MLLSFSSLKYMQLPFLGGVDVTQSHDDVS